MGFLLKMGWSFLDDGTEIYVKDKTQDYIDGEDYGWGQGDEPLQRSAYALLFFAKYIDYAGTATYLVNKDQYISSTDRTYAVAAGTGLANTDMSIFSIYSTADGHHLFYMLPLEMKATQVSGSSGDVNYNTDDAKPYYHNGSAWAQIGVATLPSLEALSSTKMCEELTDIRIVRAKNPIKRAVYTPSRGRDEAKRLLVRDVEKYQ